MNRRQGRLTLMAVSALAAAVGIISWDFFPTVDLTSVLSWEFFEGLPVGAPSASGTWSGFDITLASLPIGLWQDGEGSFRISVLSGSQNINSVLIYSSVAAQPGSVYQLTVVPAPVPEPTTSVLLYFGLAGVALWARRLAAPPVNRAI